MKLTIKLWALMSLMFGSHLMHGQIRSMLDVPSFYLQSKDVLNIPTQDGLVLDVGYGIGTHFFVTKFSAGFAVNADFDHEEIVKTLYYNPFGRAEIGLGRWRSNGQQCSKSNQNAYSFLVKGGLLYSFGNRKADLEHNITEIKSGLDYYVGGELAYFFLSDMYRNSEVFVVPAYSLKTETISLEFGVRTFINPKYRR